MKKAVIITCFDNYSYDVRLKYVQDIFETKGYKVTVLAADFDHRRKEPYVNNRQGLELLHVPAYKKNMSFGRIYSHYCFGINVYKKLEVIQPDVVYGSVPPNFIYKYCALYKRKKNNVKLIFDIGDMWPETLPVSTDLKKILYIPLKAWAYIRNKYIKYADNLIYECHLFEEKLSDVCGEIYGKTIYFCKDDYMKGKKKVDIEKEFDILNFLYLGSVNNIVDVDLIVAFVSELNRWKKVHLDIIGNGEKMEYLCGECKKNKINFTNHGAIYENEQKWEIIRECQFGLNIMKKEVFVGATMKSLEYFHWGLALINNISSDSYELVKNEKCGFNLDWCNYKDVARDLSNLTQRDLMDMRNKSRNIFESFFSCEKMKKNYIDFFDEIGV